MGNALEMFAAAPTQVRWWRVGIAIYGMSRFQKFYIYFKFNLMFVFCFFSRTSVIGSFVMLVMSEFSVFSQFVTIKWSPEILSRIKLNFSSTLLRNAKSQNENISENLPYNWKTLQSVLLAFISHSSSLSMSNLQMAFYIADPGPYLRNTCSDCCSLLHGWHVYHITLRKWVCL